MAGKDDDKRKPILTGDDLPPEDAIAPAAPEWETGDEDDFAAAPAGGARLSLGDDDGDRLPWLESADDIDADEGLDGGRIIGFVILGLLALAMIVGAVWFATHRGGPARADGSLIRAENGPYKVRPENPGGKTFEGTGDTSYAVAQGQTRPGTIAGDEPAPAPKPTATATPTVVASAAASGVGVQVGAYTSAADAEQGWSALAGRHPALKGISHRVVEGEADFGHVYRLQAVAGDLAAAKALCATLTAAGQGCQVKR
jgi:hypothetical protein